MKWKNVMVLTIFIIIAAITPLIISKTISGSNDWLGFWGSYLGAIISIGGVYSSIVFSKDEHKIDYRPYIVTSIITSLETYSPILNGSTELIYHSKPVVKDEDVQGRMLKLENPLNKLAFDIIIALYDKDRKNLIDIISITKLIDQSVLVDFNNNDDSADIGLIKIAFKTTYNETCYYYIDFVNNCTSKKYWNSKYATRLFKLYSKTHSMGSNMTMYNKKTLEISLNNIKLKENETQIYSGINMSQKEKSERENKA